VRLAGRGHWGDLGPKVGRAVSAILFGLSRGPVLLYSGQEVGEPAAGAEGFGGDDARTTIFDYWSMPELVRWVNGHRYDGGRLSAEQRELRAFYGRLLKLADEPAFRHGGFFGLNSANNQNPHFGRLPGDAASGHWLYAYLRHDRKSGQSFLVIANLHGHETLQDVRVSIPAAALEAVGVGADERWQLRERLWPAEPLLARSEDPREIVIPAIPPLTPFYFELQKLTAQRNIVP
jgi:hypothetical protein